MNTEQIMDAITYAIVMKGARTVLVVMENENAALLMKDRLPAAPTYAGVRTAGVGKSLAGSRFDHIIFAIPREIPRGDPSAKSEGARKHRASYIEMLHMKLMPEGAMVWLAG